MQSIGWLMFITAILSAKRLIKMNIPTRHIDITFKLDLEDEKRLCQTDAKYLCKSIFPIETRIR